MYFFLGALLGFVSGGLSTAAVLVIVGIPGIPGGSGTGPGKLPIEPPEVDPVAAVQPVTVEDAREAPAVQTADDAVSDAAAPTPREPEPPAASPVREVAKLECAIAASSSHKKFPAKNLLDGDRATVWQEDKKKKALGQSLTFAFPAPAVVKRIGIVSGYDAAEKSRGDLWPLNNRLKTATLAFTDGATLTWELADTRDLQWLEVDHPSAVGGFTLTVVDVYEGSWFRDNAIGEIEVWGLP